MRPVLRPGVPQATTRRWHITGTWNLPHFARPVLRSTWRCSRPYANDSAHSRISTGKGSIDVEKRQPGFGEKFDGRVGGWESCFGCSRSHPRIVVELLKTVAETLHWNRQKKDISGTFNGKFGTLGGRPYQTPRALKIAQI